MDLDPVIRSITTIFVLSLGVERITGLLKRRDWQLLAPVSWLLHKVRAGIVAMVRGDSHPWTRRLTFHVDLRHDHVENPAGDTVSDPAEREKHLREVNAENTLVVGILLAGLCGSNAFDGLIGEGHLSFLGQGASSVSVAVQIALTGAAAGVGSSFWYDILRLVVAIRKTRGELSEPSEEQPPVPDTTRGNDYERLLAAARSKADDLKQELEKDGISSVEVLPALRTSAKAPSVIFGVRGEPGAVQKHVGREVEVKLDDAASVKVKIQKDDR